MKKPPRIIIFIFTTLLVISILVFIYCFADKLTDFSFANVVLEFYILFIAYFLKWSQLLYWGTIFIYIC